MIIKRLDIASIGNISIHGIYMLDQELPNNIWTALTVSWFAHFEDVSKEEQKGWGGRRVCTT